VAPPVSHTAGISTLFADNGQRPFMGDLVRIADLRLPRSKIKARQPLRLPGCIPCHRVTCRFLPLVLWSACPL